MEQSERIILKNRVFIIVKISRQWITISAQIAIQLFPALTIITELGYYARAVATKQTLYAEEEEHKIGEAFTDHIITTQAVLGAMVAWGWDLVEI